MFFSLEITELTHKTEDGHTAPLDLGAFKGLESRLH